MSGNMVSILDGNTFVVSDERGDINAASATEGELGDETGVRFPPSHDQIMHRQSYNCELIRQELALRMLGNKVFTASAWLGIFPMQFGQASIGSLKHEICG